MFLYFCNYSILCSPVHVRQFYLFQSLMRGRWCPNLTIVVLLYRKWREKDAKEAVQYILFFLKMVLIKWQFIITAVNIIIVITIFSFSLFRQWDCRQKKKASGIVSPNVCNNIIIQNIDRVERKSNWNSSCNSIRV